MNRNINTEGIYIENNCMKIHPTSYITRKLRIKMRYYCTSFRLVKIQNTEIPNAGENMEQLDFSFIASGNAKCYRHLGITLITFCQAKLSIALHYDLAIIHLYAYPRNLKFMSTQKLCNSSFTHNCPLKATNVFQ